MTAYQDYLGRLPSGLDSHRDSLCKGSLIHMVLDDPDMKRRLWPHLPVELRFEPLPPVSAWVPEVQHLAMWSVMRDTLFSSDEEIAACSRELNARLFAKPLYRALMWVASPDLLLRGAAQRWGQFHRGSAVEVVDRKKSAEGESVEVRLSYPTNLFAPIHCLLFAGAVEAALYAAGARDPRHEIASSTPKQTMLRLRWR